MLRRHTVCCGRNIWINSSIDCADNCWTLQHCTEFLFKTHIHSIHRFLSFSLSTFCFVSHFFFFLLSFFVIVLRSFVLSVAKAKPRLLSVTRIIGHSAYGYSSLFSMFCQTQCLILSCCERTTEPVNISLLLFCYTLPVQSVGNCEIHTFFVCACIKKCFPFSASEWSEHFCVAFVITSRPKCHACHPACIQRKDIESLKWFTLPNYILWLQ